MIVYGTIGTTGIFLFVFRYSVDRNRAKARGAQRVYLPAEADRGPAAFWAWLDKYGGGGPPGISTMTRPIDPSGPALPRRLILDRFEQHTKHCKDCREAHAAFGTAAKVAALAAVAMGVVAVATAGVAVALGTVAASGFAASELQRLGVISAGSAAGATLAVLLNRLFAHIVQSFVFVDYDKAHPSKGK